MSTHSSQQTGVSRSKEGLEDVIASGRRSQGAVTPIRGGRAARIHGAILRRLLAVSDWVALIIGSAVSSLLVADTPPETIAWSVAFGPAWILIIKIHGL